MLPFEPKPTASLRKRFPACREQPVEVKKVGDDEWKPSRRVGRERRHVFDFQNGLRLIVSEEYRKLPGLPYGGWLHISGSPHGDLARRLRRLDDERACREQIRRMREAFQKISGYRGELKLVQVTHVVVHLTVPVDAFNEAVDGVPNDA